MSKLLPVAAILLGMAVSSSANSKEMSFDIIYANHTNIVVADGEITGRTPQKFQDFLDTDPFDGFVFYIDLNSPGGNLAGGMKLGRMIREAELTSRVVSYTPRAPKEEYWYPKEQPGICISACALAYLGGEDRALDERSVLGFHQFSSVGNAAGVVDDVYETETTTQAIAGLVQAYIVDMGAAPQLFSLLSVTPPERLFIPDDEQLSTLNIIPPDVFQNYSLEPYRDGVVAFSVFKNNAKGRNVVSQITLYCKGEAPYILLSHHYDDWGLAQDWIDGSRVDLRGFSLWQPPGDDLKAEYPPTAVEFRAGGRQLAEIRIDRVGARIMTGHAKGSVQLPGAWGNSMYFESKPTQADRRNIESAFKLCIG